MKRLAKKDGRISGLKDFRKVRRKTIQVSDSKTGGLKVCRMVRQKIVASDLFQTIGGLNLTANKVFLSFVFQS